MKNIYLSYILAFSKNTWFWLGIWVFYYLKFTDYSGIGLIETTLIVTLTLTEIPTGALADLIGKKNTLIIAFFLESLGAVIMALAQNFNHLIISVFIMCVGGAFYSGSLDALVYDSLKGLKKENIYDKIISNINSIYLFAPAICGIIGGFMYKLNPTYPFWANAAGYIFGFAVTFFLYEPKIDTEKFTLNGFIRQNSLGLKELFKSGEIKRQTLLLTGVGFFIVIFNEMLDSFLGVEYGFKSEEMGILWSIIYLISALTSQFSPIINRRFRRINAIIITGFLIALSSLVSPVLGLIMGGVSLIFRSALYGIIWNLTSITINENTESKYRATTLSTFNMIKNIPYVLLAYFIGSATDTFSAKNSAFMLGLALILILIPFVIKPERKAVI